VKSEHRSAGKRTSTGGPVRKRTAASLKAHLRWALPSSSNSLVWRSWSQESGRLPQVGGIGLGVP
jgi:hypothetical protein